MLAEVGPYHQEELVELHPMEAVVEQAAQMVQVQLVEHLAAVAEEMDIVTMAVKILTKQQAAAVAAVHMLTYIMELMD
jgi:hypothetical protein